MDFMLYENVLGLIGNTPMVKLSNINFELNSKLYAKIEKNNLSGSIKDRACYQMIISLINEGKLKKGSTIIEPTSGIARHDLIAALIQRDINWSSCFGMQCSLVSDRPSTTDLNYVTRTLIFECTTPRNVSVSDEEGSHIVNFELWE